MQQQLWQPEPLEMEYVTFLLEQVEQSLFLRNNFGVDKHNALHSFCTCRWIIII